MTLLQVRTARSEPIAAGAVLLDWFTDDAAASNITFEPNFLKDLSPSPVAKDLFRLGAAVYCSDKIVRREEASDLWTRDLQLQVPVSDPDLWTSAAADVKEALDFLSGDRWEFEFRQLEPGDDVVQETVQFEDAVCLFSGGLDSLTGAIDLLDDGRKLILVGHHDSSLTDNRQVGLFNELRGVYGDDRVSLRRLYLRPAKWEALQEMPLPGGEFERTTRARSFLFITAGLVVADAIGPDRTLFVPENGYIGINVPLTGARSGSLSTRTTHPYFFDRIRRLLEAIDLGDHSIDNPFRLSTKGEILEGCANPELLARLKDLSISCSHPEHPRLRHREIGNCGYCFPCLIRRASLFQVGLDDVGDYSFDVLHEPEFLDTSLQSGQDFRAVLTSLGQPIRTTDVLKNGRIPNGEAREFFDLYSRGRSELREWLDANGDEHIRARLR